MKNKIPKEMVNWTKEDLVDLLSRIIDQAENMFLCSYLHDCDCRGCKEHRKRWMKLKKNFEVE